MRITNNMYRQTLKLDRIPGGIRPWLTSKIMGRFVPFTQTAGLVFERLSREEVIVSVRNKRKVQNHIHGVHACVMALLAETATGFVTNMNCPDDKLILLKSMQINYHKVARGDMRAVATCTDAMAEEIVKEERGNFAVPVTLTDETGATPTSATMTWAWIPKKKKA